MCAVASNGSASVHRNANTAWPKRCHAATRAASVRSSIPKIRRSRPGLLDLIVFAHFPPGFVGGRSESGAGQGILVNAFWSTISEIMLFSFSSRPPAEVVLESDLIELPGLVALGAVHWDADTPPGTDVEIRTRTGDQLLQQIRYFDKTGNEKTADEYRTLAGFLKGPSDTTVVVGPGWSVWSQQYRQPGEWVSSPSLRRFMQLQVRLKNDGGQHVPELHRISVGLHQPVVQRLGAEVWPMAVEAGVLDTFALFVQPDFLAQPAQMRSRGFDEVRGARRAGAGPAAGRCGLGHGSGVGVWDSVAALCAGC